MTIPATDPEASEFSEASGSTHAVGPGQSRRSLFTPVTWSTYWMLGGALIVALLVLWWAVVRFGIVNPYFLPPPSSVWDSGVPVDHSVRTPAEVRRAATQDIRVILGLLDARPIATLSIEAQERHERRERVYRDD